MHQTNFFRGTRAWAFPLCAALLTLATIGSLGIGARFVPPVEVVQALLGTGGADVTNIVGTLRVNRTINGLICGVALGAAGVVMQSLTRNPIADPGILGVNAGASFGVVLGLTVAGSAGATAALGAGFGAAATIWFALAGAAGASAVIFALSASKFVDGSPVRLTLAGVAFSAVLAGISQALVLSNETVLDSYRFWRVGSLTARPVEEALPLLGFVLAGTVIALSISNGLNMLALGDDSAVALGVRPRRLRFLSLAAVTLLCGAATALTGPISFVGLVIPHLVRRLVGPDLKLVMPLSLLAAPALLLGADTLGRVMGGGSEVQVGVMTALIGGPLLIFFVARRQQPSLSQESRA